MHTHSHTYILYALLPLAQLWRNMPPREDSGNCIYFTPCYTNHLKYSTSNLYQYIVAKFKNYCFLNNNAIVWVHCLLLVTRKLYTQPHTHFLWWSLLLLVLGSHIIQTMCNHCLACMSRDTEMITAAQCTVCIHQSSIDLYCFTWLYRQITSQYSCHMTSNNK